MQLGRLQQTNMLGGPLLYPTPRPGLAQQGLEVYRAQGCAYCHSQQVRQSGTRFELELVEPGTNATEVAAAVKKLTPRAGDGDPLSKLPLTVYSGGDRNAFEAASRTLTSLGAKAAPKVIPYGPDIARGWGKRRTVAEDFLFDSPTLPGSQRAGPDLASVGLRLPNPHWHLRHLYAPSSEVKGSPMPPYRYLVETRRITTRGPSANALHLPPEYAPAAGFEVVPTLDAVALAAYLVSLRADAPLFSAPMTIASSAGAQADTNAPAGTNAPAATTVPAATNAAAGGTNTSAAAPAQKP
jgi:hypothetical protein